MTLTPPTNLVALPLQPGFREQTQWASGLYEFPRANPDIELFNCSVVDWSQQRWLVTRKRVINVRPGHNRISFWRLSRNIPTAEYEVRFVRVAEGEHHEDPRAMAVGNNLFLSYCNFTTRSFAHQCLARVNPGFIVPEIAHVQYGKNAGHLMMNEGHEKNWTWFWHDGLAYCVYSIVPHMVLRFKGGHVVHQHLTDSYSTVWDFGAPRGGTPPWRVGNEYFAFFHSSLQLVRPRRRYFMGAYAFSAEPPFRITRVTTKPLLCGSERDPSGGNKLPVIFPCGSLLTNGEWLVTFGVNDCRCGWIKIPHEDLLGRMALVDGDEIIPPAF